MHNGEQSAQQSDTRPDVEERRMRGLAALTDSERIHRAFVLSEEVRARVRAAVKRAFPEATQHELDWRYAEQVYGEEVAARVRRWKR